jgi:hypothetical protein
MVRFPPNRATPEQDGCGGRVLRSTPNREPKPRGPTAAASPAERWRVNGGTCADAVLADPVVAGVVFLR